MKEYIQKMSPELYQDREISKTVNLANVFENRANSFANNMYVARFGKIPNEINIQNINCKRANEWLSKTYHEEIVDCYFSRRYYGSGKTGVTEHICYFFSDDLMISLDKYHECDNVLIHYKKADNALVDALVEGIRKFKYKNRKKYIGILVSKSDGLDTERKEILKPRFSIEENYNDDLLTVHQTILNRLKKKNDKGLILLHGKPGTGKTSYIRYLITKIQKSVIFLPPSMAASITDPGLMNVLIERPDSVFVIEDAENIIIDRNRGGSSSVSALLNLADGLLSDCLNIQIICSFNTDISRVDSALTRKGRLIAKYEFSELAIPKAQALSNKLGFSSIIASPMTLASIYNQNETDFTTTSQRKSIGFQIAV